MLTKTLTAMAILMTAASMTQAQPAGAGSQSLQDGPATLSFRKQGGITGKRIGLDVDPRGAVYGFEEVNGLVTRQWGQMGLLDLQQLQAAADAFYSSRVRMPSNPNGNLVYTLVRKSELSTAWYETTKPKGKAATLIQMFEDAHDNLMSTFDPPTPPIRVRPDSQAMSGSNAGTLGGGAASGPMSKGNMQVGVLSGSAGSISAKGSNKTGTLGGSAASGPQSRGNMQVGVLSGSAGSISSMGTDKAGTLGGGAASGPQSKSGGAQVGVLSGSAGSISSQGTNKAGTLGGSAASGPQSKGNMQVGVLSGSAGSISSKGMNQKGTLGGSAASGPVSQGSNKAGTLGGSVSSPSSKGTGGQAGTLGGGLSSKGSGPDVRKLANGLKKAPKTN